MNKRTIITIWAALALVTAACALPFNSPEPSENELATAVALTVQAHEAQSLPTTAPVLPALPTATAAPLPSATPLSTNTPAAKPTATPRPCNQGAFVSETVPDDTPFDAGQAFTKSWRLKNTGTCTWSPTYKLAFHSGDQLGAPASVSLGKYVAPGEQVDILVNMKAPDKAGTYTGYWRMQADDNSRFSQVYVRIKVKSAAFAVTSVKLTASPASFNGACPVSVLVKAEITASAPGKVTYQWQRSDGTTTALASLQFDQKGAKTVQFDWNLAASGTHWVKVYIAQPNHQLFGTLEIPVTCQ